MRTTTTFSVLFWAYKARPDKNNQVGLYAKITLNGKRTTISLKRKVAVNQWDATKQKAKGNRVEARSLNQFLEETKADLFSLYQDIARNNPSVSPEDFKSHYLGEHKVQKTVQCIIDFHNEAFEDKLNPKTMTHYRTSQKYVMLFINQYYKKENLNLDELNYEFIVKFEKFLRKYKPVHYRGEINNNAAMKHIQRFRKMIKLGLKLEWLEKDPFLRFTPVHEKREREFLSKEELNSISSLELSIERLDIVRDIFIFSCYTGISYVDIQNLTKADWLVENEKHWIKSKRQKNGQTFKIPLLQTALNLLEKYRQHPKSKFNGTLLPIISNQKMNAYLKEIADLCGITKNLTFHMARHTFATTITLSNGVPIETVSKMLGHTKIATTQIYARVLERKIEEDMSLLAEKLGE